MVKVKKSVGGGAQTMDILAAKLEILEATLNEEPEEVNLDDGRSFISDPHLNVKVSVVQNMVEPGVFEGSTFYDRFKLKEDRAGDWAFAKYSKLGNLIMARYGEEWFDDPDAEFETEDFEGFVFVGKVEPKTDPKGKQLDGSTINWKGIRPASDAKKVAKEIENTKEQATKEDEEDFDSIPF